MNQVFVDTAAWLALLNSDDVWHQKARDIRLDLARTGCLFITTDFVLLEVADALCAPKCRKNTANFLSSVYQLKSTDVIALSQELLHQGLELYAERLDKDWGLTDCISFIVMRQRGLTSAFTSDKHFAQSGFTRLLT